jgi:hypothetical protein
MKTQVFAVFVPVLVMARFISQWLVMAPVFSSF